MKLVNPEPEALEVTIACNVVCLLLLLLAIGAGVWTCFLNKLHVYFFHFLGMDLPMRSVQLRVALLVCAAQLQDLMFIYFYEGENLALIFSGTLFTYEIAVACISCSLALSEDPAFDRLRYDEDSSQTPFCECVQDLFKPYIFQPFRETRDKPLPASHSTDHISGISFVDTTPLYVKNLSEQGLDAKGNLEKRNIWPTVVMDLFSGKVRSKLLSAIVIGIHMNQAIIVLPLLSETASRNFPGPVSGLVLSLAQLFLAFSLWLFCGFLLIGNNVYHSKWWLLIAAARLSYSTLSYSEQFFSASHNESVYHMSILWLDFFLSLVCAAGVVTIFHLLVDPESSNDFFVKESRARDYANRLLRKVPSKEHSSSSLSTIEGACMFCGVIGHNVSDCKMKKSEEAESYLRRAKMLFRSFTRYPTLLILSAVATIPVVLSFGMITMYCGKEVTHHARIAQLVVKSFQGKMDAKEAVGTLDLDYDGEVSPDECSFGTIFRMIGMQELSQNIGIVWLSADSDKNGSLNVDEMEIFTRRLRGLKAIIDAWREPEVMVAGEILLSVLDNNNNGALSTDDISPDDVHLVVNAVYPDLDSIIREELPEQWKTSDIDEDGELNMDEAGQFLTALKARVAKLRQSQQAIMQSLIRAGSRAWGRAWGEGGEEAAMAPAAESFVVGAPASAPSNGLPDVAAQLTWEVERTLQRVSHDADEAWKLLRASLRCTSRQVQAWAEEQFPGLREVSGTDLEDSLRERWRSAGVPSDHAPSAAPKLSPSAGKASSPSAAEVHAPVPSVAKAAAPMDKRIVLLGRKAVAFSESSAPTVALAAQKGRVSVPRADSAPTWWASPGPDGEESLESALPRLMSSLLEPLQEVAARGFAFLKALEESPEQGARRLIEELDQKPQDGQLDAHELGITSAVSMVNPSLAPRAPELMALVGSDKDGDVRLTQQELEKLLRYAGMLLLDYVGDLNEDGKLDRKDLQTLIKSTIHRLFARPPENPPTVPPPTDLPAQPNKASPAPAPAAATLMLEIAQHTPLRRAPRAIDQDVLLELDQRSGPGIFDDPAEVSALPEVQPRLSSLAAWLVNEFIALNLDKVELELYIAACMALWFGIWVVRRPFIGHNDLFERMQRGDKNYKGNTQMGDVESRTDFATFFPGLVFSTVLFGMAIVFVTIFSVLVVLTSESFYKWLWGFRALFAWILATTLIQLVILRRLVLDSLCIDNGDIVRPRMYACVYTIFVVMNFALGALAAISRVIFMLPFLFLQLSSLSSCVLEEDDVLWDIGYTSYLTMTRSDYRSSNPLAAAFIQVISPNAHRLFGPKRLEDGKAADHGHLALSPEAAMPASRQHWNKLRKNFWGQKGYRS